MNSYYSRGEYRNRRSSSAQLEPDHNKPEYINKPKNYMRKISKYEEFQDSNGNVLKDKLLDEFSTIEKDYSTQERVVDNVVKQRDYYQEKLYQMDMKTQQQLWKIEQNRIATQEKKLKLKKLKNKQKKMVMDERKADLRQQEIDQYLEKKEKYGQKMEAFEKAKQAKATQRGNFEYDYSQYNMFVEQKQIKEKNELDQCDAILRNCNDRQNRVAKSHDRILTQRQRQLAAIGIHNLNANEKAQQQYEEKVNYSLQNVASRLEKITIAEQQKKENQEKLLKLHKKQLKLKQEHHDENLQRVQEETEERRKNLWGDRDAKYGNSFRSSSTQPVKTMLQMTMEKKQINDTRAQIAKQNHEMIKLQQRQQNDMLVNKHHMHTQQIHIVRDVRQKIKDFRLKARFQQNEQQRIYQMEKKPVPSAPTI